MLLLVISCRRIGNALTGRHGNDEQVGVGAALTAKRVGPGRGGAGPDKTDLPTSWKKVRYVGETQILHRENQPSNHDI